MSARNYDAPAGDLPERHVDAATLGDSSSSRSEQVELELEAARAYRRIDYDRFLEHAESAFELACQIGEHGQQDTVGMAAALSLLAHRSCVLGDSSSALSQGSQALALIDVSAPSLVLAEVYDSMGWAHFCLGDYADALDLLLKGLRMAEEVGDLSLQAYILDSIANVHSSSEHPREALDLQEQALSMHRELGDGVGEATVLNNLAYTCMDLGDGDTAMRCAEKALIFCEESEITLLLAGVLDTLSDVHLWLGNLDAAEEYASRGLQVALERGWEADEANAMMALGRIASRRGSLSQAKTYTERALQLAERSGRIVEQYNCHLLLSDVEERLGDLAAALGHYRTYHDLEQAKVNSETQSRLASLRVEHQVSSAKKDAEIQRLRTLALEREVEERKLAQARLEAQASLDPLTGLFNRGHMSVVAGELGSAVSRGETVSLILFDVDHFKDVNDSYGHLAGDRVLLSIANELRANLRDGDTPCRYGGDEFLVLLTGIDPLAAVRTAERIRRSIAETPVASGTNRIRVTVSVGLATLSSSEPPELEALVERADLALYAAKQAGRDCVVVDPERQPG
jgi:diguanylate cyclase